MSARVFAARAQAGLVSSPGKIETIGIIVQSFKWELLNMFYEKELDPVLQEIMTRWDIPGLAVGVVEGDEIIYAQRVRRPEPGNASPRDA